MKLYFSPKFLRSAASVRNNAVAFDVNPIAKPFDQNNTMIIKPLLNGETAEKVIGHNWTITLTISADQMPIIVNGPGGARKTIEQWLYLWEEAAFRWVQFDELGVDPVRVKMTAKPDRKRVDNDDDLQEFLYSLVTTPFVLAG